MEIDNDDSVKNVINALLKNIHQNKQANVFNELYRYHHKQKLKNLKQGIYRNIHKTQNQLIVNELTELKLSNFINKEPISLDVLKYIRRLKKLSRNTLIKLAQLRNIETTGLKKSDRMYILLRSQKYLKETKYLEYLNNNTNKDDKTIKSKINEIRKTIAELDVLLDKKYKKEILKYLD